MAGYVRDGPLPRIILFGPFELDVQTGELRKHGVRIRLHEQPFRILVMLLNQPGEMVSRDDLRKVLWPNDTVVEFDHGINAAIQRLRDALGDSADTPRYVETLPRRGYRFIGKIEPAESAPVPVLPEQPPVAAAPADPNDLSGETFSHYHLIGKLGSGGMGVVYRAEDLKLGRQVALKFLPMSAEEATPLMLDRFHREARAASALSHPNICTIHGVEEFAGQPVIVMELLEGETLGARLTRGPLASNEVLPLAIQIAGALEMAHRKGIVHRDLKPANVMLTKSGPKLLDFGLAKMERAVPAKDETATAVTQAGAVLGTWPYMSPEQLQARDCDARSDLFSFGLILYEMLSGRPAFQGDSAAGVMAAILERDPAPLPESVLFPLRRLISKCLSKNPDERWHSAHDLRTALEWIAESPAAGLAPSGRATAARPSNWAARLLWPGAAAVGMVLVVLAVSLLRETPQQRQRFRFQISPPGKRPG